VAYDMASRGVGGGRQVKIRRGPPWWALALGLVAWLAVVLVIFLEFRPSGGV
jgi:hypothetical protein